MTFGTLKAIALAGCLMLADGFLLRTVMHNTREGTLCRRAANSDEIHHHDIPTSVICRRHAVAAIVSSSWALGTSVSNASDDDGQEEKPATTTTTTTTTVLLKGVVTLEDGIQPNTETTTASALYVTCRPNKPDNVPGAILSGTRGKPPPVLAARFENPTFPFEFTLSSPNELTMEGASADGNPTSSPVMDPERFWWKRDDLIVSARWDSDGVAATRSPEDLVGRGFLKNGDDSVQVILTGRGAFGKFATGKSKES
jgi:hypothetical protein